jgi:hypothetical protein
VKAIIHTVIEYKGGKTIEAEYVIGTDRIHPRIRPFFASNAISEFGGLMGIMNLVNRSDFKVVGWQTLLQSSLYPLKGKNIQTLRQSSLKSLEEKAGQN